MARVRALRRELIAALVAVFAVAHLFCVCSQAFARSATLGRAGTSQRAHQCCRDKQGPTSGPSEHPGCSHCSSLQMAAPSATNVPTPVPSVALFDFPPAAGTHTAGAGRAVCPRAERRGLAPPAVFRLKCTLLI